MRRAVRSAQRAAQGCAQRPRRWQSAPASGGAEQKELAGMPFVTRVQVRWGDMDCFQHVNNVVYAQYLEQARCELFARFHEAAPSVGFWGLPPGACSPILAAQTLKYIRPMTAPDDVLIGTRVRDVTETSFLLEHKAVSARTGAVTLTAEVKIVTLDYSAGKRTPIRKELRDAMRPYED
eukprot:TRINITY_DN30077_c0_g1_i1.p1 TRINITY_DN30077_c0_g1~~TRINITY_DN30077_c0_g1_i1.p1  ORF type:complete len:203 (+),score=59.76 TRINITY_DN30077_c0_g1_i1:74-610(+)